MKRLLGLLLVMGMVGCGGGDDAPTPNDSQAKVDEPPVQTVDASKLVKRGGLFYEGDSETPFTGVAVTKHENGQKGEEKKLSRMESQRGYTLGGFQTGRSRMKQITRMGSGGGWTLRGVRMGRRNWK